MPVKGIIHEKCTYEQVAFRLQTLHLVYKSGIWRSKLAFRLQIFTFQSSNKHLVLQTGTSDYNSACPGHPTEEEAERRLLFAQKINQKKKSFNPNHSAPQIRCFLSFGE